MGIKNIFKGFMSSPRILTTPPILKKSNPLPLHAEKQKLTGNVGFAQAPTQSKIKQKTPKIRTKAKSQATAQPETKTQDSSQMKTANINNYPIRMFSYAAQQYYCIDDLTKASKMENPEQFLKDFLIKNSKLNSLLAEVETEENGKNIVLQFATKEQITPIIDEIEKFSPKTITFSIKSLN